MPVPRLTSARHDDPSRARGHRGRPVALLVAAAALLTTLRPSAASADAGPPPPPAAWRQTHAVDASAGRFVTGKGLEWTSADKLHRLQLRARAQFLAAAEDAFVSDDERERGLLVAIRRARLTLSGHMWGEKTTYKMELAVSPADLGMTDNKSGNPPITNRDNTLSRSPLLDMYVHFKQIRDLNLRVGQYKVPYSRQRVISSGAQMFVDRAISNGEFNVDRDVGLDLGSSDLFGLGGKLHYNLGVYAGEGHSGYVANDFGLMLLARVEVLPFGPFRDYIESAQDRDPEPRLSVGVAGAWIDNAKGNRGILGRRPADGGTTDTRNAMADVMFKMGGLSLQSELFWREGRRQPGDKRDSKGDRVATEAPRDGWGAMVQGGYLLPGTDLELAGRYALVRAASGEVSGVGSSLGDNNEATLGVSYYFASHAMKLQADASRLWSAGFADGDNRARLQLQVAY
jgi:phosphate-selective porin OprO/OprP